MHFAFSDHLENPSYGYFEIETNFANVIDNKVCLNINGDWLSADTVINCGGLYAHEIATKIHKPDDEWQPPKQYFAKGNYFRLDGKSPFRHLIYPVPEPGGLGIHATIDWSGTGTKFGPDVEWLDPKTLPHEINYDPNPNSKDKFVTAIQKYYPDLPAERLQPDYVGKCKTFSIRIDDVQMISITFLILFISFLTLRSTSET